MIYIPSKEELEELGFEDGCAITISNRATILYRELGGYYSLSFDD